MSIKKVHDQQPESFEFSEETIEAANKILKNYPEKNK